MFFCMLWFSSYKLDSMKLDNVSDFVLDFPILLACGSGWIRFLQLRRYEKMRHYEGHTRPNLLVEHCRTQHWFPACFCWRSCATDVWSIQDIDLPESSWTSPGITGVLLDGKKELLEKMMHTHISFKKNRYHASSSCGYFIMLHAGLLASRFCGHHGHQP